MSGLEELAKKIKSVEDLQVVVKTMKALAVANMRQYERAVESLADYYRTVELGLHALLLNQQLNSLGGQIKNENLLAVIIGTDYGFAGQFNEEIINFAAEFLQQIEKQGIRLEYIVIGEQVYNRLQMDQQEKSKFYHVPSSLVGINPLVQKLLLEIEKRKRERSIDEVVLLYHKPAEKMGFIPQRVQLLPVVWGDYQEKTPQWPTKILPTFTQDPEQLLYFLVNEHIYVNLYRALAFSMASENASRLAAMQAAGKKISEVNDSLVMRYRQENQNATTSELLDIISGFEALTKRSR